MTHFGQQLTLAVFVLPSLISIFFFFFLRSLNLRFSGSILLVGQCQVLKRLKKRFSAFRLLIVCCLCLIIPLLIG